jgi:single-stranded-DNA-specific exonuclease
MLSAIEKLANDFLDVSQKKAIKIISHHDTDGITSATILSKALKRLNKTFSIKIVKQLDPQVIAELPKSEILIFLDLGSSYLQELSKFENVFILDHHEIISEVPLNIRIVNPHLFDKQSISGAGLTYLFAKQLNNENKDLASMAVIGMVGDMLDRDISKLNNQIINDAEVSIKKGLLLYPATRPIHKTLEYSSSTFIPGVTGNSRGACDLLMEAGIERINGEFKSLMELTDEESSKLITGILVRRVKKDNSDIIGNIYLIKMFNKLEDAREMSAIINACSRLGFSEIALLLCMGNREARKKAEEIYASYKQHIVSALNYVSTMPNKIEGKGYIIINAKENIKDTMIGTIASILSVSSMHEEGTVIITMADSDDKIKVSARIAGRNGRNLREVLELVTSKMGGETGGHALAAGCMIPKDCEQVFIDYLKKVLDIETIKV